MDIAKLRKQLIKADNAVDTARADMDSAIDTFAEAFAARAVIKEQLDQAEALELALEMRGKKE